MTAWYGERSWHYTPWKADTVHPKGYAREVTDMWIKGVRCLCVHKYPRNIRERLIVRVVNSKKFRVCDARILAKKCLLWNMTDREIDRLSERLKNEKGD